MSQGFHRPFVPAVPVPGVAVVPVRRGREGLEVWVAALSEQERRSPAWDDGEGSFGRAPLRGGGEDDAAAALAASMGLGAPAGPMVPLGRWTTPVFSAARWSLGVWLAPTEAPPDGPGAFRGASALVEAHRDGRETPGPLLARVAAALATVGHPDEAAGALRPPPDGDEAVDLGGGVHVIPLRTPTLPPATHTSCVILGGGDALVVDPGSPYGDEQQRLARFIEQRMAEGDRFGRVVLTHHHHDHAAGAEALRSVFDAVVCAHPETARLLGRLAQVDELILDGDVLPFGPGGSRGARVVATPGHAPGHVVLLDEGTGIAVAGDMVAGQGTIVVDPPEGDMAVYLRSLERLRDLGARVLVPAHGPAIVTPGAWAEALIGHRLWREDRLLGVLRDAGALAVPALVTRAYDDVPVMAHSLAARQALAHLLKLEAEGRASRTTDGRWWAVP